MIERFLNKYGKSLVLILFGLFAILASLYEALYSDYGDSLGTALREDPVWWLLVFGIFVVIAGILARRD